MTPKFIPFFLLITLITVGCDTFYTIPLSKESDTLRVNFDCGNIKITLQNWQGIAFDFYQYFDLEQEAVLHSDSLSVKYKGQDFECYFVGEDGDSSILTISGKRTVRTAFSIEQKINEGDTIIVIPDGYLYCNDKEVKIKELQLIIAQDLRGPLGS